MTDDIVERLPRRFARRIVVDASGCWLWTGTKHEAGYGRVRQRGRQVTAHRAIYGLVARPVPSDKQLDHLCRNRLCVNPLHMEVVDNRTNTLRGIGPTALNKRKTHCPAGHEYTEQNTRVSKSGKRHCRECNRLRWHKTKAESAHA